MNTVFCNNLTMIALFSLNNALDLSNLLKNKKFNRVHVKNVIIASASFMSYVECILEICNVRDILYNRYFLNKYIFIDCFTYIIDFNFYVLYE